MDLETRELLNQMEVAAAGLIGRDDVPLDAFRFAHRHCQTETESDFLMSGEDYPTLVPAQKLHCVNHDKTSVPQTIS